MLQDNSNSLNNDGWFQKIGIVHQIFIYYSNKGKQLFPSKNNRFETLSQTEPIYININLLDISNYIELLPKYKTTLKHTPKITLLSPLILV